MDSSPDINIKKTTFADKFSRFKLKFFLVFWTIIFILAFQFSAPFIQSLYSITKIKESTFNIKVQNNSALYELTSTPAPSWVPLSKISKKLQAAIIASEDGKFYIHPGYDLDQFTDAMNETIKYKKKLRGASTITQQLAKNLYLNRKKNLGRKFQELVFAIMIEKYTDKQKILETYLNIIEFGQGLFGIENASRFYFFKPASKLSARESAFLAMLLPSPIKYSKSFKNKYLSPFAKKSIDSILLKMRQAGAVSEVEFEEQLGSQFSWEKQNPNLDINPISMMEVENNDEFNGESNNEN
jgi:monofunctional biosynthetic peptidoglycan transglycosylase